MKRTKKLFIAAFAVFAFSANLFAAAPPFGALSVQGNKIVGADGQPAVLRGMSFFWNTPSWEGSKFYTAGVVNTLVDDWKATVVRVAVNPDASSNSNWQTVADAAIEKGIYVVIDWHTHSHSTRQAAISFFTGLPAKYKNSPNVIYEIFNEPCSGNAVGGGACGGDDWANEIKPYAVALINAIRGGGANNIIVIGSPDYSKLGTMGSTTNLVTSSPVKGSDLSNASYANNLVYSVHYYTAEPGTYHQMDLRSRCQSAMNAGLALLVTEWGLSEADGGQANPGKLNTDEAQRWFDFMDKNHIGWMNWSIVDKGEAASALTGGASTSGGWSESNLTNSGKFVRNALRKYAGTVNLEVKTAGEGSVTRYPAKTSYTYGSTASLKAVPAQGWKFDGWTAASGVGSAVAGAPDSFSINPMYGNVSITATFVEAGNMITNGSFTSNISGWTPGNATAVNEDQSMRVHVTAGSGVGSVRQPNISLESGKTYTLKFRAKAASGVSGKSITPKLTNSNQDRNYIAGGPFTTYPAEPFALTASWQEYSKTFEMCYKNNAGAPLNDASAAFRIEFEQSTPAWTWYLDEVSLNAVGTNNCQATSALPVAAAAGRAAWSVVRVSGGVTLRGPVESGSKVTLYDVRGKAVRTLVARDGMTIGASIPAGNYFLVVRNAAGREVLWDRFSLMR
jgi:endoglucanase